MFMYECRNATVAGRTLAKRYHRRHHPDRRNATILERVVQMVNGCLANTCGALNMRTFYSRSHTSAFA